MISLFLKNNVTDLLVSAWTIQSQGLGGLVHAVDRSEHHVRFEPGRLVANISHGLPLSPGKAVAQR